MQNPPVTGWPEPARTQAQLVLPLPVVCRNTTGQKQDAGSTREGGGSRRSASAEPKKEENGKEQDEEGRDGGITDREGDEEVTPGQRNAEIGVWLLPHRGEEEDKAADGGLSTAANLGGGAQNPATLLEKRGIAREATNEKQDAGSTREGGGSRRSTLAEPKKEENAKEQDGDEKGRDGGITDQEGDEEVTPGQRNTEIGVWFLPNQGEEEDEVADGGWSTAATLEGRAQNPALLLEKCGIARCVGTPD
ncbi:hypothetical protein NDU88_005498 [Pleurodeles waltl]|uniref:Uncharacterized protein n=1 Tax=Pleurodeles waltl TaxID=8319 RepID=A0AAV7PFL0_PLEWA|nr:hypothetical protein NDU88_005498 [Pleurodeles waltl]